MELTNKDKIILFLSGMLRKLNEKESQEEFIEILEETADRIDGIYL